MNDRKEDLSEAPLDAAGDGGPENFFSLELKELVVLIPGGTLGMRTSGPDQLRQ